MNQSITVSLCGIEKPAAAATVALLDECKSMLLRVNV
jgi:hypothetical protein